MDIFKYESKLVMAKLKHKLVELTKEDDGDLTKPIYYPAEYAAEVLKMIAEIESDYVLGYWLDEDDDEEDEDDLPIRTVPAEDLPGLPGGDAEDCDDYEAEFEDSDSSSKKKKRRRKCKSVRINTEAFKEAIISKYGTLANANNELGRSHDYLHQQFRKYKAQMPIDLLTEINDILGVDFEDFRRKNSQGDSDRQIDIGEVDI